MATLCAVLLAAAIAACGDGENGGLRSDVELEVLTQAVAAAELRGRLIEAAERMAAGAGEDDLGDLRRELRREAEQAETSAESGSRLLASADREIRTPLTDSLDNLGSAASSLASLAEDPEGDAAEGSVLEAGIGLENSGRRLEELVENVPEGSEQAEQARLRLRDLLDEQRGAEEVIERLGEVVGSTDGILEPPGGEDPAPADPGAPPPPAPAPAPAPAPQPQFPPAPQPQPDPAPPAPPAPEAPPVEPPPE